MFVLCLLCFALVLVICILTAKIVLLYRAADEIRIGFAAKLESDTNTGIDISSANRHMQELAAEIDRQLGILRKERIRFLQGDHRLKEAVTNISHDLRTPLTAICGYVDFMEGEELSDTARQYLAIISNRIDALKRLTEEFYRYSIVFTENLYDVRETVALNQEIEECVAAYYAALKERGITPEIRMPSIRIERQLDKAAVTRILLNVMSNAVKYSDGDLTITLKEDGRITFENSAAQLDKVLVGRLFDRFYTVETAQNSSGLGLSIAKALTEHMGGTINANYQDKRLSILLWFPENSHMVIPP